MSAPLLDGSTAVVTGGAGGIGAAIALRFAEAGSAGVVLDLPSALVGAAVPPKWQAMACDVSDEQSVQAAFRSITATFGRIDTVVANAGVVPPWRETEFIDLAEWDIAFGINVRGMIATIKHSVPAMKAHGGSIIAMASLNAWRAHPQLCLYTATKHAVLGIVRSTALDLGRYGIRVNAIGPGPVATDAMLSRMADRAARGGLSVNAALEQASATALGRIATTDDIAGAALFLASTLSAGMTGQLIPIDAGVG
jgi:NAD(P)-dependent dehydrogenase (short-subunit alcohol dehydrogenase family)